jgi:hypothetical protein
MDREAVMHKEDTGTPDTETVLIKPFVFGFLWQRLLLVNKL